MIVFPAQAGIQRSISWIPAFAGMADRVSSHLRDTILGCEMRPNRLPKGDPCLVRCGQGIVIEAEINRYAFPRDIRSRVSE